MSRRYYCGIVGCGLDAEGDRCPECGAPWSVHREIDAATCGAFTPCPNASERRDPAMPGRQLRDHGHHCELAPGHTGERRATKTRAVREVPAHPVLSAVLGWWRCEGWAAWYGREPQPHDLIAPARAHRAVPSVGAARRQPAVWRELQSDLAGAGVREHRVHDLRHTFASLCADAGMAEHIAARWTHTATATGARSLYVVPSWDRQCAEMLRLVIRSGLADRVTGERTGERVSVESA